MLCPTAAGEQTVLAPAACDGGAAWAENYCRVTSPVLIFFIIRLFSIRKGSEEETPKKQLYFYYPYDSSYVIKPILEFNNSQDRIMLKE